MDVIPTMKTQNERICLFLDDGRAGFLRIEDAERLQVWPASKLLGINVLASAQALWPEQFIVCRAFPRAGQEGASH